MRHPFGTRTSRTRRTWIVATTLAATAATGSLWADLSATPATSPAPTAAGCHVFAGRAGYVPCSQNYNDPQDRAARTFVGRTGTGCALGLIFGGPAGVLGGCVSGAASNIPW